MTDLAEEFARARRRKLRIAIALAIVACAAPIVWVVWTGVSTRMRISERREAYEKEQQLDDAAKASYRELLAQMKQAVVTARAGWLREVTPEKLAAIVPGAARCPRRFEGPTAGAAASYTKSGSIDMNYFGSIDYVEYATGTPLAPRDLDGKAAYLAELERKLDSGEATRRELSSLRRMAGNGDALILVATRIAPIPGASVGGTSSYISGRVVGAAYLYSYPDDAFVCAATIEAENSAAIETEYRYMKDNFLDESHKASEAMRGALVRDLEVQLQRQIASRLRAI